MSLVLLLIVVVIVGCLIMAFGKRSGASRGGFPLGGQHNLGDAEAEARRWVERLGAGIAGLDGAGNTAATQALADASERYNAASVELGRARSATQFGLAGQTAIEGLHYIRAARTALGMDPGPEVPALGQVEGIAGQQRVVVGNQEHYASPQPGDATPYYYPGGQVGGRPVPAGWYSTPWWKTALVAGAAGVGGALLFDALLDGFGGHHHGPGGFGGFGGPGGFGDFGGPGGPF
ncbi:hypothetical protein FPZ12_030770 [Amycolatopsis acidicola]|uniref:DUF1542 domain-containing protein n=1 Tax=Amycolatopsis acidicola TaxID=2596893 RepID=A0A5N0UWF0_9PSEU|nr:hypothetical protein [Amycolatopsis acidicola]KAA9155046.1 hypothetical protein FPZ12_030770 [Amycolatopsis acidicola]